MKFEKYDVNLTSVFGIMDTIFFRYLSLYWLSHKLYIKNIMKNSKRVTAHVKVEKSKTEKIVFSETHTDLYVSKLVSYVNGCIL